ncbi:hypothetical protein Ancab_012460, partial [Ancistrocladus abbreviatus]
ILMGDKKENEHITIPMAVHESSYQPLLPSENASPEIMLDETSQLTPSADASSTAEPPPSVDAPPQETDESKDDQWTAGDVCLCVVVIIVCIIVVPLFLLYALGAYLLCNKDVTEDTADDHGEDEGRKQPIYLKVQEF